MCAFPLAAAWVAYYFLPPSSRVNYGELVEPRPLPSAELERVGGGRFAIADLKGKWVLVQVDEATCAAPCQAKLFNMRQSRLAQGDNADRVGRLWLVVGGGAPAPELAHLYQGVIMARAMPQLIAALPGGDARDHIYLIDPRGAVMLRFPKDADPKRMIKDLQRLLRYSGIG